VASPQQRITRQALRVGKLDPTAGIARNRGSTPQQKQLWRDCVYEHIQEVDAYARQPEYRADVSAGGGQSIWFPSLPTGAIAGGRGYGGAVGDSADRLRAPAAPWLSKIVAELRRCGILVNHERVACIMREDNFLRCSRVPSSSPRTLNTGWRFT